MTNRALLTAALATLTLAQTAQAGVYLKSGDADTEPFIVVHSPGYDGASGTLPVRVCLDDPNLKPAVERAIEWWEALTPTQGNCEGPCTLWEEDPPTMAAPRDMTSTVAHELGHCAFGLGHTNWKDTATMLETSFTNSQDAVSIDDGTDDTRGSFDDLPSPLPGTRLLHWFRLADNNPVVIDGTVIDGASYTRRIIDLPAGSWLAGQRQPTGRRLPWCSKHTGRDVLEAGGKEPIYRLRGRRCQHGTLRAERCRLRRRDERRL